MEGNKPRCPHCGAPQVRAGVRFCNYCGQPIAVPPQPTAPARRASAAWLLPAVAALVGMLLLLGGAVLFLPKLRQVAPIAQHTATATPPRLDTPAPTEPTAPVVPSLLLRVASGGEMLDVYSGPGPDYETIAAVGDGFSLEVLGRTVAGDWFLVRLPSDLEGWVDGAHVTLQVGLEDIPIADVQPIATQTPTVPAIPTFVLEHQGCMEHALNLGQVKGQVFDRNGHIIVGAEVEVLVAGQANVLPPGRSNSDGWYEFNVSPGQTVRIVRVTINGQSVSLDPIDLEVEAKAGCFQRVDIRER